MRPLRRWVPAPARRVSGAGTESRDLVEREEIAAKDLMFCAEFAVHGGVAVSSEGFRGEGELLRMQRCGLLDLERDPAPPFAVTRVALSAAARDHLFGAGGPPPPGGVVAGGAREAPGPRPNLHPNLHPSLRRGFEVARGMISAAVKTELAAWRARGGPRDEPGGGPGGGAGLETRIMTRINRIEIPFEP